LTAKIFWSSNDLEAFLSGNTAETVGQIQTILNIITGKTLKKKEEGGGGGGGGKWEPGPNPIAYQKWDLLGLSD